MAYRVGDKTFVSSALAESYAHTLAGTKPQTIINYKGRRMTRGRYDELLAQEKTTQAGTSGQSSLPGAASANFEKAIAQYAPGGGFGKGVEAGLERGRVKSIASGTQAMVSAGLAGTSVPAGLGKKYEEEVAAPTRAGVESERAQRLSSLYATQAGAEQGGYESAQNRALQLSMQRYGEDSGGNLSGFNTENASIRQDLYEQQLKLQAQKKKIQKETVSELTGGQSGYGKGYFGKQQQSSGTAIDYSKYRSPDLYQGESPEWRAKQDFSKIGSII